MVTGVNQITSVFLWSLSLSLLVTVIVVNKDHCPFLGFCDDCSTKYKFVCAFLNYPKPCSSTYNLYNLSYRSTPGT